jgi:hypothetical protein
MRTVSFEEYQAAKNEIIYGVEYKAVSLLASTRYSTGKNGSFYEVTENGIVEFWSDRHPESRYYDARPSEEIIAQNEERLAAARQEKGRAT